MTVISAEGYMIFLATLIAWITIQQNDNPTQAVNPTAKSVIEKFIAAKGGDSALRKTKDCTITGKVFSNNKIVGELETYHAANRYLSIHRFPDGTTRRHGTDGKLAWRIDVHGNPSLLKGQEARDFIRHNSTMHESLEWTKQFDTILYAGKKTVQDDVTHHLIFVAADKRQINRYFSVKTGLLIREEHVIGTGENIQMMVSEIGNYFRDINGIMVSRQRVNHFGSAYSIEFKIESIKSNTLADSTVFTIPDSVAELIGKNAE